MTSYAVPFPSAYTSLVRSLKLLQFDLVDVMPIGCLTPTNFHHSVRAPSPLAHTSLFPPSPQLNSIQRPHTGRRHGGRS